MRLHRDWRRILLRAWSVRLIVLGFVVQGAALYWTAFEGAMDPMLFFGIGLALQVAAGVSRIIDQGMDHADQ
jgi:hypothetical protein